MSSTKPTIFIVNGSFGPSPLYVPTTSRLEKAGYNVIVADYPSIGRRDPKPAATMEDDAEHVHSMLEQIADKGNDILVVAHSYGGIPASQGLKGLAKTERANEGKKGGVVRILYVAALVPDVGQCLVDLMGEKVSPVISMDGEYMSLDPEGNARLNFSDMPFEEALVWAKQMPQHSAISFGGKLTYQGYKDIPVSYFYTSEDPVVLPEVQKQCIATIEKAKNGEKIDVIELNSGHIPFLSRVDETVRIIGQVASK